MVKFNKYSAILFLHVFFFSCSQDDSVNSKEEVETPTEIPSKEPVEGIRIAWDHQTLKQISESNSSEYNGYARLIELYDNSILTVYESNGNVVLKKSEDYGNSWSAAVTVVASRNGINMATPDLIQLKDHSILISYNPRPTDNADPSEKFAIRTIKSYGGGSRWHDDQLVYEASNNFGDGAWEPSAVQLPNGEIQLFFSNENIYRESNEQNISLLRSQDNGITWTSTPEIASFTSGSRDGMPSPLLLNKSNEIVFAIEDNSENNQFKPYIIRNSVDENWKETVTGNSPNRSYSLSEELDPAVYAGAPYLAQLSSGETLLSYQGTEGRPGNNLGNADMKVVIGDERAYNFDRKTVPFIIEEDKSALWNSIAVLEDDSVIALTTTNAFSNSNASEVWMIKGYVISEIIAFNSTINIDGSLEEDLWKIDYPVFIGHKGSTQLYSNVAFDDEHLYVVTKVIDKDISTTSSNPANNDAVVVYLDPHNESLVAPGPGIFKIVVSANSNTEIFEGDDSAWTEISGDNITTASSETSEGYFQEIAIPWSLLGGKAASNSRIGFNMELLEKGESNYKESISSNLADHPYSWSTLKLNN